MTRFTIAALSLTAATVVFSSSAQAQTTSAEVIARAQAIAAHPWTMTSANETASCSGEYRSEYVEGDHMGLPYDWGGYMSLHWFDTRIDNGYGAGSYPADGILECTVGLDCSGFVSQAWGVGHNTTSSIPNITRAITRDELKRGDVYNDPGYHVAMYSHTQPNGRPFFYESIGYNVHPTFNMGWSYVNGFEERRYLPDSDNENIDPVGTPTDPIEIVLDGSGNFVDSRDTTEAFSDVFDYCDAAPDTRETGPEYVYRLELTQPGRVVADLQVDAGADIDIHFYRAPAERDCFARDHWSLDMRLDCGVYYVVADTWVSAAGDEAAGGYDLTISFTPESGSSCGSQPGYDFLGAPNTACSFPGNSNLSFCNANLGSETCVYTGTSASDMSFCTFECGTNNDCGGAFPGGCCAPVQSGTNYCMPSDLCGDPDPDDDPTDPPDDPPDDPNDPPDPQDEPDEPDTNPDSRPNAPSEPIGDPSTHDDTDSDDGQDDEGSVGGFIDGESDDTPGFSDGDGQGGSSGSESGGCATTSGVTPAWPALILVGLVLTLFRSRRRDLSQ